jgi:hypothetical protein
MAKTQDSADEAPGTSFAAQVNGPPPSSIPLLSSVGVLDKYLGREFGEPERGPGRGRGRWLIEDVWIAMTMLSAEIVAWLWSWDGEVTLSASWNEAYYTEEEAGRFLALLREELLTGLAVH